MENLWAGQRWGSTGEWLKCNIYFRLVESTEVSSFLSDRSTSTEFAAPSSLPWLKATLFTCIWTVCRTMSSIDAHTDVLQEIRPKNLIIQPKDATWGLACEACVHAYPETPISHQFAHFPMSAAFSFPV